MPFGCNRSLPKPTSISGLIASRSGKLAEAEAHYRNALAAAPHTAAALINLGNLLAQQHGDQEAVTIYHEAIQLKPTEATIHLSLASWLAATGRIGEAVEQFRRALVPECWTLLMQIFNLGVLLANGGDRPGRHSAFTTRPG